jgi:FAD synthase
LTLAVVTSHKQGSWVWDSANLNPEDLPQELLALPKGVYYGWAQVRAPGLDTRSHMMVMNIGNRPTFADSGAVTLVSEQTAPFFHFNQHDLLFLFTVCSELTAETRYSFS